MRRASKSKKKVSGDRSGSCGGLGQLWGGTGTIDSLSTVETIWEACWDNVLVTIRSYVRDPKEFLAFPEHYFDAHFTG